MSQLQNFEGANNPILADIETITGNSGGAAGPDGAGNFNIVADVNSGLTVVTDNTTNTATIYSDNTSGTATTIGAVTEDIITYDLGLTPGTFQFEARVKGFESTTPAGVGYNIYGTFTTDGITATLVGDQPIFNEDPALSTADAYFIASGNNAVLQVLGVAALTIVWSAESETT